MVRCGWAHRFVHGCLRDCVHGYVCVCIYAHCDCACYVRIRVVSASYNCGACRHVRIACRQVLTTEMYLEACLWLCVPVCTSMRDFLCVYVCACAACMLRVPISALQVSVCVGVFAFASRVHQVPQKSGAS